MTCMPYGLQQHWMALSPLLSIRNEDAYDGAVERLNHLLDEVGTDEQHPLYTLLDTLGTLLHAYEEQHHPMPECSGVGVPLDIIAVTSRVPEPLPQDHVILPWHAQRHPRTGLTRKCAAVCTWVVRMRHTDIREVCRYSPQGP